MSTLASRLLVRNIKPSFIRDHIQNRAAYVSLDPGLNVIRKHSSDTSTGGQGCKTTSEAPKKRVKTPIGKLDELEEGQHPYQEKEPLKPWPNSTNPHTGEVGGPKGPEPTRYGDWERKGRVSDF